MRDNWEYKSNSQGCESCLYLSQCTARKNHVKLIARHIWGPLHGTSRGYPSHTWDEGPVQPEKTIERIFGSAKEYHGFRYTNMIGKARVTMKVALAFTCINLQATGQYKGENPSLSGCLKLLQQILMSMFEAQNKMAPAMLAETTLSTICRDNRKGCPFFRYRRSKIKFIKSSLAAPRIVQYGNTKGRKEK